MTGDAGWFTDPYGQHQARWVSGGMPTKLVTDSGVERYDDPPDMPSSSAPVRIVDTVVAEPDPRYGLPSALPQAPLLPAIGRTVLVIVLLCTIAAFDAALWGGSDWPNVVGPTCLVAGLAIGVARLVRRRQGA